jgi:hypothetical protein
MTHPDDIPVESDEQGLDPSRVSAARTDADEADLIEQATAVPDGDDDRAFDR